MAGADSVIPPPLDDDDDDVAWALQTAAVQWTRGGRADAVVWLRRAVDAAIAAGNPTRTKDLTRLASQVADRLVEEAARAPDSAAPPPPSSPPPDDVDDLLTAKPLAVPPAPRGSVPRPSSHTLSGEIPIDFSDEADEADLDDDFQDDDDLEDDDAPTIPPPPDAAAALFPKPAAPVVDHDPDADPDTIDASDEPFESRPPGPLDEVEDVSSADLWSHRPRSPSDDGEHVHEHELFSAPPGSIPDDTQTIHTDEVYGARPGAPPSGGSLPERPSAAAPELGPNEPETDGPTLPRHRAVAAPAPSANVEPAREPAPSEPPWEGPPVVGGIALDSVRGFEDLPEEMQAHLARVAILTTLGAEEEVGSFGAALVTNGRVGIMPSIADVASAVASAGEIVFTRGSLVDGVKLRVVAIEDDTVVASWSAADLDAAFSDCPWVADELRLVADRYQALAGATLGLLGERLDETLRGLVLSRLDVKAYGPLETIVTEGKAVPGLHVVGGGKIELLEGDVVKEEASPGDFLFAAEVLSAGKAHQSARAGKSGALILFAPRSVAHEMLMSVPPLLEILAG